jgi:hypothetical protein
LNRSLLQLFLEIILQHAQFLSTIDLLQQTLVSPSTFFSKPRPSMLNLPGRNCASSFCNIHLQVIPFQLNRVVKEIPPILQDASPRISQLIVIRSAIVFTYLL